MFFRANERQFAPATLRLDIFTKEAVARHGCRPVAEVILVAGDRRTGASAFEPFLRAGGGGLSFLLSFILSLPCARLLSALLEVGLNDL